MMRPSVGRVLHLSLDGRRVPCVVTHVWSDECVNVVVFATGVMYSSVLRSIEDDQSASQPNTMNTPNLTWSWPPAVRVG